MILNLSLLLIVVFLLIFLSMIWPPDSPWAPWWRTSDENVRKALRFAGVKNSDVIYDLGSGDGRTLIIAAKEFGARGVGVEIDPLRFYISKLLVRFSGLSKKIELRKENFLDSDISDASVIFVYLVPNALRKLKPKFLKELKRGTRIVSIKYKLELPVIKSVKGNKEILLYRIS